MTSQNNLNETRPPWCIVHIPHGSFFIPTAERKKILISEEELQQELIRLTDWYVNELFAVADPRIKAVIFPYSRLLVDVERFPEEENEVMAKFGMGVIYTRTLGGKLLREPVSAEARRVLIKTFYQPYHWYMEASVKRALDLYGSCLILDCHSFPSQPFPYEEYKDHPRPEICIGYDPFHTSGKFLTETQNICQTHFKSIQFNRPFSGSFVPAGYYQSDKRVASLMIEVNRGLYIQEKTGNKTDGFEQIKSRLQRMVMDLINAFQDMTGII